MADQRRRSFSAYVEWFRDLHADCLLRFSSIQRHTATEIGFRIDVAEHEVGIRDGWFDPAEVIAYRTRDRTRAVWPNLQSKPHERVKRGDRATTCTDRDCLQHSNTDHPRINDRPELIAADTRFNHQRDIKTGPAHVAGDDVFIAERRSIIGSAH